jgi:hypothetical protein
LRCARADRARRIRSRPPEQSSRSVPVPPPIVVPGCAPPTSVSVKHSARSIQPDEPNPRRRAHHVNHLPRHLVDRRALFLAGGPGSSTDRSSCTRASARRAAYLQLDAHVDARRIGQATTRSPGGLEQRRALSESTAQRDKRRHARRGLSSCRLPADESGAQPARDSDPAMVSDLRQPPGSPACTDRELIRGLLACAVLRSDQRGVIADRISYATCEAATAVTCA